MTYQQNASAIGTYRAATAVGDRSFPESKPFAAFDKEGRSWRITEAEAEAIRARIGGR